MLATQLLHMRRDLHTLAQSVHHRPQGEPALNDGLMTEQLVSGLKEAVDILRASRPAPRESGTASPAGAADTDARMGEPSNTPLPAAPYHVTGQLKRGPVRRGVVQTVLAVSFFFFQPCCCF